MSEIVKSLRNDGKRAEYTLYYYRDRDQKEVDILYIKDQTLYPIEIKRVSEKIMQTRISVSLISIRCLLQRD